MVKIFCQVHGKSAMIVGYGPGRKGKPVAIVISGGVLKSVRLKDIILDKANSGESETLALGKKRA